MTLAARTTWTLRGYWADRLGVGSHAFDEPGVTVGRAADAGGLQLFCRDETQIDGAPETNVDGDPVSLVAGAPESLLADTRERAGSLLAGAERSADDIREWFAAFDAFETVLGPSFYGYADRETFDPQDSTARVLAADDETAFGRFRAAVPDGDWDQGGPRFQPGRTVGLFDGGTLVAGSGYEVWDGLLAHLGVVVHPEFRGEGHGRAVVSRATEHALAAGYLPQYRTSDDWPWSVALAESLGFERFATAYLGRTA